MSPVEWVDELPQRRRGRPPRYGWEVEYEVRANPGRWAKVFTYPATSDTGKPSTAASSAAAGARKRGFDTAVRPTEDKTGRDLYLRWPAENAPAAPKAPAAKADKDGGNVDWAARAKPGGRRSVGYPCDHCDEELTTPAALRVHVRKEHPEQAA